MGDSSLLNTSCGFNRVPCKEGPKPCLVPVLELVSEFILEESLKLVALQDALLGVSLPHLLQETLSLRLYLPLLQEKVRRRVWVLTPKIHTALKITIGKLSSKKMSSLKLLAAFFFLFINLLYHAQLKSVADYLLQVVYNLCLRRLKLLL